jgi:hypothetical protein
MDPTPAPLLRSQFTILPGGRACTVHGGDGGSQVGPRPTLPGRSRAPIFVAFAVAALALVMWIATSRSGPAALRQLPAGERAALVERTLSNLREICRAGDRPRDFCREQARLLLGLPECGPNCQAEARDELLADSAVK